VFLWSRKIINEKKSWVTGCRWAYEGTVWSKLTSFCKLKEQGAVRKAHANKTRCKYTIQSVPAGWLYCGIMLPVNWQPWESHAAAFILRFRFVVLSTMSKKARRWLRSIASTGCARNAVDFHEWEHRLWLFPRRGDRLRVSHAAVWLTAECLVSSGC